MEVCLLAQWGDVAGAQPLFAPLQHDLRLLHPPLPVKPSAHLAAAYPYGNLMGLPCSVSQPDGLGPSLSAGGILVHDRGNQSLCTLPHTVWLKPVSIFGFA